MVTAIRSKAVFDDMLHTEQKRRKGRFNLYTGQRKAVLGQPKMVARAYMNYTASSIMYTMAHS